MNDIEIDFHKLYRDLLDGILIAKQYPQYIDEALILEKRLLSSYDKLLGEIGFLGELFDNPMLSSNNKTLISVADIKEDITDFLIKIIKENRDLY